MVAMVRRENKDHWVHLVHVVTMDHLEPQEIQEDQVLREVQGSKGRQEKRVIKDA